MKTGGLYIFIFIRIFFLEKGMYIGKSHKNINNLLISDVKYYNKK